MTQKQEITATSVIQRNESKFLASALGDEIVMMNTDSGDYIGVNSVGSDIWAILAEPMRVDQLVSKLGDLYDADAGQLKTEVNEFVQRMLKQDMIVVTNN